MEVGVPRPRARSAGDRRWRGRDQLAGGRVDPEDEDSVEALVGDDEEAPARVEGDVVRMRAGLLGAMRPRLALERDEIAQRPERAVGVRLGIDAANRFLVCANYSSGTVAVLPSRTPFLPLA